MGHPWRRSAIPNQKNKSLISHGMITHSIAEAKNCNVCRTAQSEYNEAVNSGEIDGN